MFILYIFKEEKQYSDIELSAKETLDFLSKELSHKEVLQLYSRLLDTTIHISPHLSELYKSFNGPIEQRCTILKDCIPKQCIKSYYYQYLETKDMYAIKNKAHKLTNMNITNKEKFIKNGEIDPAFMIVNTLIRTHIDIKKYEEIQTSLYENKLLSQKNMLTEWCIDEHLHLKNKIIYFTTTDFTKYKNHYQNIYEKYYKKTPQSPTAIENYIEDFTNEYIKSLANLVKRLQKEYNKEQQEIQKKEEMNAKKAERREEFDLLVADLGEELAKHITKYPLSPEDMGLRYEQYIGYLYESEEYEVIYNGATQGKKDGGRDLIAKNKQITLIIQCKNIRNSHEIHEHTVNQLNSVYQKYAEKHPLENVHPRLITTYNNLDEEARDSLKIFNIIHKVIPRSYDYPMIKCNINKTTGKKIYHLPTDSQYNRIKIRKKQGNFYCWKTTVAERYGFTRTLN